MKSGTRKRLGEPAFPDSSSKVTLAAMVVFALTVIVVSGGACSCGAEDLRQDGVFVRDSAGVTVVDNAQEDVSNGCIVVPGEPKLTIVPSSTNGYGVYAFHRVLGGALLGDGSAVLLNAGTQELLFFSETGEYRRAVGGRGRGPGEFIGPDWLGHGSGDTLFVWDTRQNRLSMFDAEGEFLTSVLIPVRLPTIRGRFEDGSFLVDPIALVYISRDGALKEREPLEYQRYDPGSNATNHLANGLSDEWVDGHDEAYSLPFGKDDRFTAHGEFFVVGDNAKTVLRFHDMEGNLRRLVSWVSDPIPVTEEDRRNYIEYHDSDSRQDVRQRRSTPFADRRPNFSEIRSDRTGWLWVREFAAAWEPPESWLVFDQMGVLQCRVQLPYRFKVLEIGEEHILGLKRNELDEEYVLLFDLMRNH